MKFNKLVRDKIPEMIEKEGYVPETEILSSRRFLSELDRKLGEEVDEYRESGDIEEIADILEVLYSICDARGYSFDEIMKIKEDKKLKRGGFSKKIFLIAKHKK